MADVNRKIRVSVVRDVLEAEPSDVRRKITVVFRYGTVDYRDLHDKPRINGNELIGDMTAQELGLATPDDLPDVEALSNAEIDQIMNN